MIGTQVGQFVIQRRLGRGGMGADSVVLGVIASRASRASPASLLTPHGRLHCRPYAHELRAPSEPAPARPSAPARRPAPPPAAGAAPGGGARYRLGPKLGAGGMAEVFLGAVIGA